MNSYNPQQEINSGLVGEECQEIPGAALGMSESCQPCLDRDPALLSACACQHLHLSRDPGHGDTATATPEQLCHLQ